MPQVPIISGIYTDGVSDYRTAYPVNLVPVPKDTGISAGYLRPADGLVSFATGPGLDRGGIVWNGVHYRVMGTKLVSVSMSGVVTTLGDVWGVSRVSFDYGFGRLAIASGQRLYYWDGSSLVTVTDTDIGPVLDVVWGDGYYLTTDGESIVQTELNDPAAVNPLKYGSAEADPDGIVALQKVRRELYVLGRNTTEVFQNVGGEFFAWAAIAGAQIQKGAVGVHACCVYLDAVAFVGSGRNEPPAVYLALNGSAQKLSTRDVDIALEALSDTELSEVLVETREWKTHQFLIVHLPDRTFVYDAAASAAMGLPVWHILSTAVSGFGKYKAQGLVYVDGRWFAGDPTSNRVVELVETTSDHFGIRNGWEFSTQVLYNSGAGAIMHSAELTSLTGRCALGVNPTVWLSYSNDGMQWSQEKPIYAGMLGDRLKRLQWRNLGHMRNWRVLKFRGTSDSRITFSRLEVNFEALES